MCFNIRCFEAVTDKELTELTVFGTDFVKTHFVDYFLELLEYRLRTA